MASIHSIQTEQGFLEATISVSGRDARVWFKSKLPLTDRVGDALLLVALPAAMRRGERLSIEIPVSPQLLQQLPAIQGIYRSWEPKLQKIEIKAAVRDANGTVPDISPLRRAISFTGGVDSFYSALNIDGAALLYVHGLDVPLAKSVLRKQVSSRLNRVATGLNRTFLEMETNVRDFSDRYLKWQLAFGGVLAACALLLSRHLNRFGIPAGQSLEEFQPDGAHPVLNALFSTEYATVETVGCEARRIDKVEAIAGHPLVQGALRVCWENRGDAYNCGVCEKCLRTMAALEIFSALEFHTTFEIALDYGRLSRAVALHKSTEMFIEENLEAARRNNAPAQLIKSLEKSLDPRRVWLFRLMHNKIPVFVFDRWYRIRRCIH